MYGYQAWMNIRSHHSVEIVLNRLLIGVGGLRLLWIAQIYVLNFTDC